MGKSTLMMVGNVLLVGLWLAAAVSLFHDGHPFGGSLCLVGAAFGPRFVVKGKA